MGNWLSNYENDYHVERYKVVWAWGDSGLPIYKDKSRMFEAVENCSLSETNSVIVNC